MLISKLGMEVSPSIKGKIIDLVNDNYLLNQDMFCNIIKEFINTDYKTDEELILVYCSSKGENK